MQGFEVIFPKSPLGVGAEGVPVGEFEDLLNRVDEFAAVGGTEVVDGNAFGVGTGIRGTLANNPETLLAVDAAAVEDIEFAAVVIEVGAREALVVFFAMESSDCEVDGTATSFFFGITSLAG